MTVDRTTDCTTSNPGPACAADLSTLRHRLRPMLTVDADTSAGDLDALFDGSPDALGIELRADAASLGVIPRPALDRRLSRDWFQALHRNQTLRSLFAMWREPVLTLTESVSITEAAARALDRSMPHTYDPLLVTRSGGDALGLLDVRDLLERQTRLLRDALDQVERERDAADRATRSKSEFLANMSHEIRTPMTAILGFADLLLEPALREAERASYVQTIQRNGDHLLAILNDILDLSKIESGKLDLERVAVDLPQMIEDVASLMRVRAHGKGLPLHIDNVGELPNHVICDPVRVRQVLMNLLGNAIKFTESGYVALRTRWCGELDDAERGELEFTVRDTGIGVAPQRITAIFEPFAQADSSSQRRFGGSGLGLAISKRLAEMMGGSLAVESTPGQGSSFCLRLGARRAAPTSCPRAGPQSRVAIGERDASLSGRRVLLAEDGVDNQRLITRMLQTAGMTVTIAGNGRSAVDRVLTAGDQPFHVVLMDMQMPELDGYGATRELREQGFEGPIIALTAHAMSGDRERCIAAGCDDFETKPVRRQALLDCIARVAGRPAADRAPQA